MPYFSHLTKTIEPALHHMRAVNLDSLVSGYIEAACWSSVDWNDESSNYESDFLGFELSDSFKQKMRDRVARTLASLETRRLFRLATLRPVSKDNDISAYTRHSWTYDDEQWGHDLWLTENGHGVGYWCRDELNIDIQGESLGDRLSDAVKYREAYLYLDENQQVCID